MMTTGSKDMKSTGPEPKTAACIIRPGTNVKAPATTIYTLHDAQNRAELLRLSVQDHYTDVVTTRGHQLVLLPFADALREVGNAKGLQVHRSHWISDADVMSLKKQAGRLFIVTRDGSEIPVSRSYSAQALARYADRVPIY
ncbi:LytTR family transcriptional regulator [Rhizobium sp. Td3]|nr:LytTR family transcriptional regulator [Rhizobium sp. RM]TMV22616.1 LytTR family transcriptional regulator [Rhizobium sp. Td3]